MIAHRQHPRPAAVLALAPFLLLGCGRRHFPTYAANYREYAYVANAGDNTVTVLDLVNLRRDRVIDLGGEPTGLTTSPLRNELYVPLRGGTVRVLDLEQNRIAYTFAVRSVPAMVAVSPDGKRGYVPNSGSNSLTVLDLENRRVLATVATGETPTLARVAPDNRSVVVLNKSADSISVYSVTDNPSRPLQLRSTFDGCADPTDLALVPNSTEEPQSGTKAFVTCSGADTIMAVWLSASPESWRGRQDESLRADHLLAFLRTGLNPTHLAIKPDNGEIFSVNTASGTLSEISTWTNEVEGTYVTGAQPAAAAFSRDNSTLWITNGGSDSASVFAADDGRVTANVHTGIRPQAVAFSADEHIVLTLNMGSSDVSVVRTQGTEPTLFTMLPAGARPVALAVKNFTVK